MSYQVISCPHCGHGVTKSINDKVKSGGLTNCVCSKCHGHYAYQNAYGKVIIVKK